MEFSFFRIKRPGKLFDKKLTVKKVTSPRDDVREEDLRGRG
jgi:hypothetical protein